MLASGGTLGKLHTCEFLSCLRICRHLHFRLRCLRGMLQGDAGVSK